MFGSKHSSQDLGKATQKHKSNSSHGHRPTMPQPVLNHKRDAKILNHNLGKAMNSYDTIRNMIDRGDKVVSPVGNVASNLHKTGVHIGL